MIPKAATVVLLRRDPDGAFSVFLVRRNAKAGFFPHAWVFPGGRVDADDALAAHPAVRGGQRAADLAGTSRDEAVAWLVAAARETWEEASLSLCGLPDADGLGEFRVRLDAAEAPLNLDTLVPFSWWVTPEGEPRRFDTWFVAAEVAGGGRHDDAETVDSRWIRPAEALALSPAALPLAPPTRWALRELARHATIEAVFDAAARRPFQPILPIREISDTGFLILLPGHPRHPAPARPDLPAAVVFEVDGGWRIEEPPERRG